MLNHMSKQEDLVDVLNEPVSHETSLYFFRHFTITLEKIRKGEMEKYKKKLYGPERELAEVFSTEYMRKIIHVTALQIKAMSEKAM